MHAKGFLEGGSGKLVCDDYAGYKALFAAGITEVGCLAHARRKFHDLWVNHQARWPRKRSSTSVASTRSSDRCALGAECHGSP
jgi:hypothetical protein